MKKTRAVAKKRSLTRALASPMSPGAAKKKRRKTEVPNSTTSFNKDFSLPRYLGDGIDSSAQQEGNWRWEAGRYHNPYHTALSDRPISRALLEKLSYNFVGEVISIHPTKSPESKSASIDTLAMVTIRLMVLPEHTHSGRLARHGPLDLFDCDDLTENKLVLGKGQKLNNTNMTSEKQPTITDENKSTHDDLVSRCFLRVPIEELVIVEKKIRREYSGSTECEETIKGQNEMIIRHSYSFLNDAYSRCEAENPVYENSADNTEDETSKSHICRRCRHISPSARRLTGVSHTVCQTCFDFLKRCSASKCGTYPGSKSKKYRCDCNFCADRKNTDLLANLETEVSESESKIGCTLDELESYSAHKDSGFIATRFIIKNMNPVDFAISPSSLVSFVNSTSSKKITKIKPKIAKGTKKPTQKKTARSDINARKRKVDQSPPGQIENRGLSQRENGSFLASPKKEPFRSTSSRLLPYDVSNRKFDVSASELYQWKFFRSSASAFPEKPRNLRKHRQSENGGDSENANKKKTQGRAARAKQRRLLRGANALGIDVDTLAGRETNVRFDRSNIHGWGVFTDIDIRQGEMIIEYRGELIGNAVAEKREKEYEAAKIGSDYMFRIDDKTVCDASKHGNVARFINASCTPNCYPKIIFLDGTERVVVYAKRDLRAGEELCYDYKFDLEYDPEKRIPCICGSPDCRGFLNWDQRYVALPPPKDVASTKSSSEQTRLVERLKAKLE